MSINITASAPNGYNIEQQVSVVVYTIYIWQMVGLPCQESSVECTRGGPP